MELLVRYGTQQQKARWLTPLLEGKARSCFAMTEPQVPHLPRPFLLSPSSLCSQGIQDAGGSNWNVILHRLPRQMPPTSRLPS
jgi:hypothetical protein